MKALIILLSVVIVGFFFLSQRQQIKKLESELATAQQTAVQLQSTIEQQQAAMAAMAARAATAPAGPSSPGQPSRPATTPSENWMWDKSRPNRLTEPKPSPQAGNR